MGGLWTMVSGSMKRVKGGKATNLDDVGAFMVPLSEEIKRINKMNGTYAVAGKFSMGPGQPMQEFTGTEKISSRFGGLVQENFPSGDGYEGYGATIWDHAKKCYRRFSLNSWGMHHMAEARWNANHLIFTFEGDFMGQRLMSRTILEVDKAGKPVKTWTDALMGSTAPFRSFEARHSPKNAGN